MKPRSPAISTQQVSNSGYTYVVDQARVNLFFYWTCPCYGCQEIRKKQILKNGEIVIPSPNKFLGGIITRGYVMHAETPICPTHHVQMVPLLPQFENRLNYFKAFILDRSLLPPNKLTFILEHYPRSIQDQVISWWIREAINLRTSEEIIHSLIPFPTSSLMRPNLEFRGESGLEKQILVEIRTRINSLWNQFYSDIASYSFSPLFDRELVTPIPLAPIEEWIALEKNRIVEIVNTFQRSPHSFQFKSLQERKSEIDLILSCLVAARLGTVMPRELASIKVPTLYQEYWAIISANLTTSLTWEEVEEYWIEITRESVIPPKSELDVNCLATQAEAPDYKTYTVPLSLSSDFSYVYQDLVASTQVQNYLNEVVHNCPVYLSPTSMTRPQQVKDLIWTALCGFVSEQTGKCLQYLGYLTNRVARDVSHLFCDVLSRNGTQSPPIIPNLNTNPQLGKYGVKTLRPLNSSNFGYNDSDMGLKVVSDAYRSQWESVGEKLEHLPTPIRSSIRPLSDLILRWSESDRWTYIINNSLTKEGIHAIATQYHWETSFTRGFLRGLRRQVEAHAQFPPAFRLTTRNSQFQTLRDHLQQVLETALTDPNVFGNIQHRLQQADSSGTIPFDHTLIHQGLLVILGKFQKFHLLHLLIRLDPSIPLEAIWPTSYRTQTITLTNVMMKILVDWIRDFLYHRQSELEPILRTNLPDLQPIPPSTITAVSTTFIPTLPTQDRNNAFLLFNNPQFLAWVKCGLIPSEKIAQGLTKLLLPLYRNLSPWEWRTLVGKIVASMTMYYISGSSIEPQFLACIEPRILPRPFFSKTNTRQFSPYLLDQRERQLIKRPGNSDLIKGKLSRGEPVQLTFKPGDIARVFGIIGGKPQVKTLIAQLPLLLPNLIQTVLTRKKYPSELVTLITTVLPRVPSFITFLGELRVELQPQRFSPKVQAALACSETSLCPLRIIPPNFPSEKPKCHLIFSDPTNHLKPRTQFASSLQISSQCENTVLGLDLNSEGNNRLVIAPEWEWAQTRGQLSPTENDAIHLGQTAIISDQSRSQIVKDSSINTMAQHLKTLDEKIQRLTPQKQHLQCINQRKRVLGINQASQVYQDLIDDPGIDANWRSQFAQLGRQIKVQVHALPRNPHLLKDLRKQRANLLYTFYTYHLALLSPSQQQNYIQRLRQIQTDGKRTYHREGQLSNLQQYQTNLRSEAMNYTSQTIASVLVTEHPIGFAYEALHFQQFGLQGNLGTSVQYMPKKHVVDAGIKLAQQIRRDRSLSSLQTRFIAVDPRYTSRANHIPSGLPILRKRGEYHYVTMTPETGSPFIINTHVHAAQVIAARGRTHIPPQSMRSSP